ncbi:MAG: TonB-dependent receptor [Porphyromonas sp.]|nr:TonB-dependent receptor [Porphyromonas sp.]
MKLPSAFNWQKLTMMMGVLFLALQVTAWGQQSLVSGVVTDQYGEPLMGVGVQVKNTSIGVATNIDGRYSIEAKQGDVLIFKYVGMKTREVTVGNQTVINVTLQDDIEQLAELVVVGYGTQKREHLTGAVSTISNKDLTKVPSSNVSQLLIGRAPGISGIQSGGAPGSDGTEILLRGLNTYNGSSSPLVLVDGVERKMNEVNPQDIESISVLRDAAAAAVYGMRAGNGVILITTKRGRDGRHNISYAGSASWSKPTTLPEFVNGLEYMQWYNKALELDGKGPKFTEEEMKMVTNGDPTDGYENTDWLEPAMKSTLMQKHTVAVTGGSERIKYYTSGEILNQNGILDTNRFNQYGFRSNIDTNPVENVTFSLNLAGRLRDNYTNGTVVWGNQQDANVWGILMYARPFVPREYQGYPTAPARLPSNPYYSIGNSGFSENKNYSLEGSTKLQWDVPFLKGLNVSMFASWNYHSLNSRSFNYSYEMMWYDFGEKKYKLREATNLQKDGSAYRRNTRNINYTLRPAIEYNQTFDKHSVGVLFLYEQNVLETNNFMARRRDFDLFDIPELDFGKEIPEAGERYPGNGGGMGKIANAGYVGRVNYAYDEKYLAEFSFRYDGTYLFAKDYRWGFFPSGSFAWVASKEDFIKDNTDIVDLLKLRASIGQLGRNTVAPYLFLKTYGLQQQNVAFGKDPLAQNTLFTSSGMPLTDLTWEKTRTYNLGLDVTLWKGLLGLEFDVFYKYTYDILQGLSGNYPPSLGGNFPTIENSGTFDNRGFELVLSHRNNIGEVYYNLSTTMSYTHNRILKRAEADNILPWQSAIGRSVGRILGYKTDGLFQTEEELINAPKPPGNAPRLGDIRYVDINGDGRITYEDRVEIAPSRFPKFVYSINGGLSWRGVDFAFMFQGASQYSQMLQGTWNNGAEDMTPLTRPFYGGGDTPPKYLVENSWRPDNTDAKYPRLSISGNQNNAFTSDYWLVNGSYLRLKNVTLGYTLPETALSAIGLQNLRLYVAGVNLLTFSGFKYLDPEAPSVLQAYYPQQKSVSVGLEVAF